MKRAFLCFVLICIVLLCSSCEKPASYPLDTDMDAFFQSHMDEYTAAAEILWEYGEQMIGKQKFDSHKNSWRISTADPEIAIDSPLYLNYFTKEQWQIVSHAYLLTKSLGVSYYQSDYIIKAPGIAFYFVTQDSNGKIVTVSYVYIKPMPGGAALQKAAENDMIIEQSQIEDEWEKLDAEYWYRGMFWHR